MMGLWALVKRNTKLYFKDKGMFFSSLITPVILLVLYATFLKNVYDDSFVPRWRRPGQPLPTPSSTAAWAGSWFPRCWRSAA